MQAERNRVEEKGRWLLSSAPSGRKYLGYGKHMTSDTDG